MLAQQAAAQQAAAQQAAAQQAAIASPQSAGDSGTAPSPSPNSSKSGAQQLSTKMKNGKNRATMSTLQKLSFSYILNQYLITLLLCLMIL